MNRPPVFRVEGMLVVQHPEQSGGAGDGRTRSGQDRWDVAYAVLYLASDEAKYVTGTGILVDGGLTLKGD
jgi:NAD(P)-dependent dehydrogenase (short-subunit alcohol dehydrogenase family)